MLVFTLIWFQLRLKHIQLNVFNISVPAKAAVVGGAMSLSSFAYDIHRYWNYNEGERPDLFPCFFKSLMIFFVERRLSDIRFFIAEYFYVTAVGLKYKSMFLSGFTML